jgi:type IV pilus assembly protein PilA
MARLRHSKGFTLVELMVVIVIVGILSAVALPKFLGVKDKAKLNTQINEAAGLAKECAAAIISEGPYPSTPTTPNVTIAGGNAGTCTPPDATSTTVAEVKYTITQAAKGTENAKCGPTDLLAATKKCQIIVGSDGNISYNQV